MSATHSFSVELAGKIGLREAILLNHFGYWHMQNRANRRHYYDNHFWTYNTVKAFNEQYPYLTPKEIRSVLDRMEAEKWIVTGNYNEKKMDRTKWYALTETGCFMASVPFAPQGKCNLPTGQMHLPVWAIPFAPQGKAIPLLTITNSLSFSYWKKNKWTKPVGKPRPKGFTLPAEVSETFAAMWARLTKAPKWRKKDPDALSLAFKKLSKFEEAYAIGLMETAIMNDYQGVVFSSTEVDYRKWQQQRQPTSNGSPFSLSAHQPVTTPKPSQPSGAVR